MWVFSFSCRVLFGLEVLGFRPRMICLKSSLFHNEAEMKKWPGQIMLFPRVQCKNRGRPQHGNGARYYWYGASFPLFRASKLHYNTIPAPPRSNRTPSTFCTTKEWPPNHKP